MINDIRKENPNSLSISMPVVALWKTDSPAGMVKDISQIADKPIHTTANKRIAK